MLIGSSGLLTKSSQLRVLDLGSRLFGTTTVTCGRKSRDPYDKRFGIRPSDAGPDKPGGSVELKRRIEQQTGMPQPVGVYDLNGEFHFVKEMVPEFVVPDLKDFKLQPYVSYRCPDIKQSEFTAKDLFDAAIAKDLVEKYKEGKIDLKTVETKLQALKSTSKTDAL